MKRFITILLCITLMGTLAIGATSCKRLRGGTEAAKILIARQNLGASAVDTNETIWGMMSKSAEKAQKTISNSQISNSVIEFNGNESRQNGYNAQELTFKDYGNYCEFTDFPIHSSVKSYYNPHVESVEDFAFDTAKTIGKIKNKIGVVDKWIKGFGETQYMLSVKGETEYLYSRDEEGLNYSVAKRHTTENARSVYESISFATFEQDGQVTYGKMKDLYIPGERYESYYDHSSGFRDYVIIDNSRGYWSLMSFNSWADSQSVSFDVCIIKDGVGYCMFLQSTGDSKPEVAWFDVFDPVSGNDYMRIREGSISWSFEVNLGAITKGLKGLRVYGETMDFLEEYGDSYRLYGDTTPFYIISEKGEIAPETKVDNVTYLDGQMDYEVYDRYHSGNIEFIVDKNEGSESVNGAVEDLLGFLNAYGMQACFDGESIGKGVELATLYSEEFPNAYSWNGYPLSNFTNYAKGKQVLFDEYQKGFDEYAKVKDAEVVNSRQRLANGVDFAEFKEFSGGQSEYANGKIKTSGVNAKITDTTLLEVGTAYKLKIGLTKVDKDGNFSSVNTVSLNGGNAGEVTFNEGGISLQANGEYDVPKSLSEGDYMTVAYVSTSDDIRVSEMQPIAFFSVEEGELESTAMAIQTKKSDEKLIVSYSVKLFYDVGVVEGEFSANELEKIMIRKIIVFGYPKDDEMITTDSGVAIENYNEKLKSGRYRLKVLVPTKDGIAEAYVYCTVK